jgi:uncharacterized protein YraI
MFGQAGSSGIQERGSSMKSVFILVSIVLMVSACTPYYTPIQTAIIYPTKTNLPTSTSTSTYTQSPSPTPVGLIGCVGTNFPNVRSGPGTQWEVLSGLLPGTCVVIRARDQDASWGYLVSDDMTGWVFLYYLVVEGDINSLPLFTELTQTPLAVRYTSYSSPTIRPSPTVVRRTSTPRPSPTQSILLCSEMINYVGRNMVCKLPRAYCSYKPETNQSPTFCNDAPYPSQNFALVVYENDWSDLDGYCIVVTGVVTLYQGTPQIEVSSRSQVSYCP